MSEYRNNVANEVSGTPGTGTITLGAAVAGAQGFSAAYGANATVDVFITDGAAWEVARNCTYTHSGTTLTRGTLEASSTGSALSLTSAAVVRVALPANTAENLVRTLTDGFNAYGDGTTTVSLTNGGTTLVSTAAKTVEFDTQSAFNSTTGIWFPNVAGLYLIGGSAIHGTASSDGSTTAVYVEHSTDGSTWSASEKRALLWRGVAGASSGSVGGSGAYIVSVNGTTDRFRMTIFYSGTGSNVCPAAAANRDWIRFWARYLGETA
jgi:hypothetical protein